MGRLVLNVDDVDAQRHVRTRILRAAGFEVIEAVTGAEALELAEARHPALIMLDVHLPDIDGREVCRRIKSAPATADILVLHVSAIFRDAASRTEALNGGADGYLTETVAPQEMVAHVNAILRLADRKETENRIRASEERLRLAQQAGGIGICDWNVRTGEMDWSPELERIYGLAAPDNPRERLDALSRLIPPEDGDALLRRFSQWLDSTEAELALDYRVVRPDGQERWIAARGIAMRDAHGRVQRLIGTNIDITEREALQKRIEAQRAQLEAVYQAMSDGVSVFNPAGELVFANDVVAHRFGYEDAAHMGALRLAELRFELEELDGTPVAPDRWPGARVLRGEIVSDWELRVRRLGMPEEWILSYNARPVRDDHGRVVLGVVTSRDISESKRAERALTDAHARLADIDRRKDEFLAVLSHELRNPLAPIRFALPLLQGHVNEPTATRALSVIQRQVDHLTRLVDDLLDVSRIEQGKTELRREHVTIGSIVTAAVEEAAPRIDAGRHDLAVVVPAEPIWVYGDPARLAQVVTNLLVNAAKFTPAGGRVALHASTEKGEAVIRVRDNGAGIESHLLPTVFDMFSQAVSSGQPPGSGLGIGLALVKRLVELHGGTVQAHSEGAGQGAEFAVRLPIGRDANSKQPELTPSSNGHRKPLRVLIADDNTDFVEILALLVEGAGHDVRKAFDGRGAISAALDYRPHLALLDLDLPDMSGIEVVRVLRQHAELSGMRLAALTGWAGPEQRQKTRTAGFEYHLTKPADPQELERLLAELAADV